MSSKMNLYRMINAFESFMKIDTLGLQAFVAIAEQASFQKAAETLYITQTALTRRLQNLEALLGVKLIERTTRSVAMTQLGSRLFSAGAAPACRPVENALAEIHKTGRAQRGDVSIACVPTVGVQYLPHIIQDYAARYPQNRIKILDHASSGVADAVLRREAEFGINIGGPHQPELTSVAAVAGPLRADLPRRSSARQAQDRIVEAVGRLSADLRRRGQRQSAAPRRCPGNAERYAPVSLRGAAQLDRSRPRRQGCAAAVVPTLAIQKGAYPRIKVVALNEPVVSRTLVLVARKTAHLSPAAQALYDMIGKHAA